MDAVAAAVAETVCPLHRHTAITFGEHGHLRLERRTAVALFGAGLFLSGSGHLLLSAKFLLSQDVR